MKETRKILIGFTVCMIILLLFLICAYKKAIVGMDIIPSFSDEELSMYRQIWSSMNDSFEIAKQQIFNIIVIFWFALLVAGYIFIALFYHFQIKPVREMEQFAAEIAKGNLDVSLPIHKNNMFGNFTESFDLMREELKSSKEREHTAEHAKRELVAELSHDLKTPVATIKATCEVMEVKYKDEEEILEKVGSISNKADTINELVQNVFRATLEDMDEIEIKTSEVDSRLIEKYLAGLKDYGKIIFDNHIPECLVSIDKMKMQQVIDNIVGNSYKYAGTDIHVNFEEMKDVPAKDGGKNSFIRIRIKDAGPGVPDEELPLVVEKYYRAENVHDKSGYGLGLYLVKHYMERQGGGMEYYNDNGFVVELLVKKV